MKKISFVALFLMLATFSCMSEKNHESEIVGVWTMEKVYEYDQDVTEKHNPKQNRWIAFNADSTYVSDGDPFGRNTGKWHFDHESSILYIDSDMEGDDSVCQVLFAGNEAIWTGIGHPRKENTRLVHKKKQIKATIKTSNQCFTAFRS